ncbi:MAG: YqgE/AlgH family protein [Alphaproteobacteria bacterium]
MSDIHHTHSGYLTGQFLVAMPAMTDPRFQRTVIYLCVHNAEGAMGLVVNRLVDSLTFDELLEQLEMDRPRGGQEIRVHFGGPVESGRGFVLHSTEYMCDGTVVMDNDVGLTATVDILRDIAGGAGPRDHILALGYAGWGPGQLDAEIQENAWLTVPAEPSLLFDEDLDLKWERAVGQLGFDPSLLSVETGRA